jgi:hypothetical protein
LARVIDAVAHYRKHGWARLGRVLDDDALERLRARADALMLGEVTIPGLFFQRDAESGRYDDLEYGKGWCGPTLAYRKLEKLEKDPLFLSVIEMPLYEAIVRKVIEGDITIYRAMLMNKSPHGGSETPWHQDGGEFWGLDRNPVIQIWTGLDDAPEDGGCIEVVDGSHKDGLVSKNGGLVGEVAVRAKNADALAMKLPTLAGDALLIHNHVWHRSGRTKPGRARRAFTVCYMSAETRCLRKKRAPREFFPVFR